MLISNMCLARRRSYTIVEHYLLTLATSKYVIIAASFIERVDDKTKSLFLSLTSISPVYLVINKIGFVNGRSDPKRLQV